MTWKVVHAVCGQEAERDDYGFIDEHHEKGWCRTGAHHPTVTWGKSPKASLRGKKGTF